MRSSHSKRLVRIFAQTDERELSVYKPVCTLVRPFVARGVLESPLQAARFVSLIPFERVELAGEGRVERWHLISSFLARGCGDSEDHAVLLCSLLLGFSMKAYVCSGTNGEGAHTWVITVDQDSKKVQFWESLTGQRFVEGDPRVQRFFRTVDCVFNNGEFYANL